MPFAPRFAIALLLIISASVFAILQSPPPDAFRRPRLLLSLNWWRYPLEWNAPARLPRIGVELNAVDDEGRSDEVWAVGNNGMVVGSADGITWDKKGIINTQISTAPSTPTPTPTPAAKAAKLNWFQRFPDLIPTAHAAEGSPQINPGSQQQGPPPTPTPTAPVRP